MPRWRVIQEKGTWEGAEDCGPRLVLQPSVPALVTLRKVIPKQPSVPILKFISRSGSWNEVGEEQGKPLLLVDVDGVISLWGFAMDARPEGAFHSVDGLPHFLSSEAGRHLQELSDAFALVWCTGWEEKADEYLPDALGVPGGLPHLSFDRHVQTGTTMPGHWKLGAIDAYAGPQRPLAWIDDAFNDACHRWADERQGPTKLVTTQPSTGLQQAHADELFAWAAEVTRSRPARFDA